MSSPAPGAQRIGWFGKIPSMGDFVVRGLPASLVNLWDAWLSAELSAVRLELADTWAMAYRNAPILCFSLGAGVADERAWQGILVPSFDRVGREFPLTIACSRPATEVEALPSQWWSALVSVGKQALAPGCGADALSEALEVFVSDRSAHRDPAEPDGPDAQPGQTTVAHGQSAWWAFPAAGSPEAFPALFNGLPRGADLRGLLGFSRA
jgi:type VI secretion system protein ImpM